MSKSEEEVLLDLNQRLLDAIANGDWAVYRSLCAPDLTAFEPEARGQLVEGLAFHRFYFENGTFSVPRQTTMASARVRIFGDVAIVCYVRLLQAQTREGFVTQAFEETRVWHRHDGQWRHVHFHRSDNTQWGNS